jgi:hypothetical protein
MKTEELKIIVCEHTQNEVLYDVKNKICLHNETIEQDQREVQAFIREHGRECVKL